MFDTRKRLSILAALALVAGSGIVSAPAVAADGDEIEVGVEYTAPLNFGGFDADIAAQNGYQLRVDPDGLQYITSIETPLGDLTDAQYLPRPVDENGDVVGGVSEADTVSARGVVTGNCGSSNIFFESYTEYSTAYTFNKPGGAYEHTWIVTGKTGSTTKNYNLSGLSPFGGSGWVSGLKSFSQEGRVNFVKVTTGVAYGVAGWVCYSGNPSASR